MRQVYRSFGSAASIGHQPREIAGELGPGAGFDLPHALPRDAELAAELDQARPPFGEHAPLDHGARARVEGGERRVELAATATRSLGREQLALGIVVVPRELSDHVAARVVERAAA